MTTIKELSPKLGDRIKFVYGHGGLEATVIGIDGDTETDLTYCIAWKIGEQCPHGYGRGGNTISCPLVKWVDNRLDYDCQRWCDNDYEVIAVEAISTTIRQTGMACKSCHTFNEYAQANQADGTYSCFVCRSRGY